MEERDDAELLEAWKGGHVAAGEALVRRHWSDLLRFFLAATGGDQSSSEDLAQETMLTVLCRRDAITSSFRAYCYGVARLKRHEAFRARTKGAAHRPAEDHGVALVADAGMSDDDRQRCKLAISVLRRLEEDDQLLLVLKDYLGFTQPELAETFKIGQSQVSGRINRARLRFRREFEALEQTPEERELTMRSLGAALASIVAKLSPDIVAVVKGPAPVR